MERCKITLADPHFRWQANYTPDCANCEKKRPSTLLQLIIMSRELSEHG